MSNPILYRIQIISPHQDDAAFSLALNIAEWIQAGVRLTIVNCFTVSGYAPRAPEMFAEAVSRNRRLEDFQFSGMAGGAEIVDLGFLDAPLRLGLAVENVCVPRSVSRPPMFDPAAGKLVQSFLSLPAADLTLVPLAIGGHIDHLLARGQAIEAFAGKPIAFYQDLPYASRFTDVDTEIASILAEIGFSCTPFTNSFHDAAARKLRYISAYGSQAAPVELAAIAAYPGERLWLTARVNLSQYR